MGRADQYADVSPVLLRLATWLDEMHGDLVDAPLHAARTSQTGVRATMTGRPMPCPASQLDEWIELESEVLDVMVRAAGSSLPMAKRRQGAAACCRWLAAYPGALEWSDEPDQVVEDIVTLELSMYRRWSREVPKGYASNWLDMQQVLARARTHGVAWKADRVRKWRQRKHVRARRFGEQWCYWWPDLQQRLSG